MKAGDADLRERASALWDTIQRDLMTQPSMVRLVGQNRPLADVLRDLERQTGLTLQLDQSGRQEFVPLREPAANLILDGDRAARAAKAFIIRTRDKASSRRSRCSNEPVWEFTSTAGPFRVSLTGLHLHRDRQLIRGPWVRIDRFGQRINVPE